MGWPFHPGWLYGEPLSPTPPQMRQCDIATAVAAGLLRGEDSRHRPMKRVEDSVDKCSRFDRNWIPDLASPSTSGTLFQGQAPLVLAPRLLFSCAWLFWSAATAALGASVRCQVSGEPFHSPCLILHVACWRREHLGSMQARVGLCQTPPFCGLPLKCSVGAKWRFRPNPPGGTPRKPSGAHLVADEAVPEV